MKYNERGKSRIEVSDILNYFKDIDSYYNDCTRYDTLKRMLEDIVAETKEDAERKKGKWILITDNNGQHFVCDECGEWKYHQKQNFCGNCGLKMEEGGQDGQT